MVKIKIVVKVFGKIRGSIGFFGVDEVVVGGVIYWIFLIKG